MTNGSSNEYGEHRPVADPRERRLPLSRLTARPIAAVERHRFAPRPAGVVHPDSAPFRITDAGFVPNSSNVPRSPERQDPLRRDVDPLQQIVSLEVDVGDVAHELAVAVGGRSASEVDADAIVEHQGGRRLGEVASSSRCRRLWGRTPAQLAPPKHLPYRAASGRRHSLRAPVFRLPVVVVAEARLLHEIEHRLSDRTRRRCSVNSPS